MVEPGQALQRALQSLTDGPGDSTSIEGAKVNALESIAWSLIGLLSERVDDPLVEDLTSALQSYGFVTVPSQ